MAGLPAMLPSKINFLRNRVSWKPSKKEKEASTPTEEHVTISGAEYQATPPQSPKPVFRSSRPTSLGYHADATSSPPPVPPRNPLRGNSYPESSAIPRSQSVTALIGRGTSQAAAETPSHATPVHAAPENKIKIIHSKTDSIGLPKKSWLRDPAMRELIFLFYYVYNQDAEAFFLDLGPHIARSLFESYLFVAPELGEDKTPERQLADMLMVGNYTAIKVLGRRPSEVEREMVNQCWAWIQSVPNNRLEPLGYTESVTKWREENLAARVEHWRARWRKRWSPRLSDARKEEQAAKQNEDIELRKIGVLNRWSEMY